MKWFKYKMTAPPMAGYIEAESESAAHELMQSHDHFAGYNNSANTVSVDFMTEDTDQIREWVGDVFRPNEAVRADGTVVRRSDDW